MWPKSHAHSVESRNAEWQHPLPHLCRPVTSSAVLAGQASWCHGGTDPGGQSGLSGCASAAAPGGNRSVFGPARKLDARTFFPPRYGIPARSRAVCTRLTAPPFIAPPAGGELAVREPAGDDQDAEDRLRRGVGVGVFEYEPGRGAAGQADVVAVGDEPGGSFRLPVRLRCRRGGEQPCGQIRTCLTSRSVSSARSSNVQYHSIVEVTEDSGRRTQSGVRFRGVSGAVHRPHRSGASHRHHSHAVAWCIRDPG